MLNLLIFSAGAITATVLIFVMAVCQKLYALADRIAQEERE
jgi:hypothetical protein